jgi:hypothetical protein
MVFSVAFAPDKLALVSLSLTIKITLLLRMAIEPILINKEIVCEGRKSESACFQSLWK